MSYILGLIVFIHVDHSKATNIKRFMDLLGSVFDSEEHGDGEQLYLITLLA